MRMTLGTIAAATTVILSVTVATFSMGMVPLKDYNASRARLYDRASGGVNVGNFYDGGGSVDE